MKCQLFVRAKWGQISIIILISCPAQCVMMFQLWAQHDHEERVAGGIVKITRGIPTSRLRDMWKMLTTLGGRKVRWTGQHLDLYKPVRRPLLWNIITSTFVAQSDISEYNTYMTIYLRMLVFLYLKINVKRIGNS